MKVVAFSPIRLNSKRVVGKNLKLLGGKPLLSYLFDTLVQVPEIDEVYAFCSDERICQHLSEKVKFLQRDKSLDEDDVLGEQIYDVFVSQVEADLYILDCVDLFTLSFKSALFTDFFSMFSLRCSP